MKRKYIIKGLAAVAAVMLPACTDNYLQVEPTTSIGQQEVTATVDNAKMAINGLCNAMQTQYQSTSYNQYNGESYINTLLDDALGPDYISGLGIAGWGEQNLKMDPARWQNEYNSFINLPWNYCYNLISQANVILQGIDNAEGSDSDRNFVKAQALTFRAFAFTKLLQWYAPRWEDSKNGTRYCVVLRLTPGTEECPLSTMGQCLDQIYADLDLAIECYNNSSSKRLAKWQPDLNVAYGVYARAALIKNDWRTAQTMAHNARQGYDVMDNDTYLSGFAYDNNDFMWTDALDETSIYYWSWGSHYSVNGAYTQSWGLGAGAISMDLVRDLDPKDIRLQCFITPAVIPAMNAAGLNKTKVTDIYFYDEQLVNLNDNLNVATGYTLMIDQTKKGRYGLYNFALNYIVHYYENIYKGPQDILENEGFYPYYTLSSKGATILNHRGEDGKLLKGEMVVTPFGAQLKFVSIPPYGIASYPYMRASEMCLAEAEAAYHNQDYTTALACLKEINGKRIPGYNFSATDARLLEQIQLCRRIELWGEGHNWSDFKRWNLPIVRTAWKAEDEDSGNWKTQMGGVVSNVISEENSHWTMPVPSGESDYNKAIDRTLLIWD